jgi:hypothetical protein
MKISSILFAAATMYFFIACNDGSELPQQVPIQRQQIWTHPLILLR